MSRAPIGRAAASDLTVRLPSAMPFSTSPRRAGAGASPTPIARRRAFQKVEGQIDLIAGVPMLLEP
jgi:hypothetical protein